MKSLEIPGYVGDDKALRERTKEIVAEKKTKVITDLVE